MSKLQSLEEEPPSLAQAERPLVQKSSLNLPISSATAHRSSWRVPLARVSSSAPRATNSANVTSPASRPPSGTTGAGRTATASAGSTQLERIIARHRRRARRDPAPRGPAADRHDAVLHEPARRGRTRRRACAARRSRRIGEFVRTPGEADDPLGEDGHSPVPGLVHRYPDRVLLLVTNFCSVYCRYCTRARLVGASGERALQQGRHRPGHRLHRGDAGRPRLLISGGDPLSLDEDRLE